MYNVVVDVVDRRVITKETIEDDPEGTIVVIVSKV